MSLRCTEVQHVGNALSVLIISYPYPDQFEKLPKKTNARLYAFRSIYHFDKKLKMSQQLSRNSEKVMIRKDLQKVAGGFPINHGYIPIYPMKPPGFTPVVSQFQAASGRSPQMCLGSSATKPQVAARAQLRDFCDVATNGSSCLMGIQPWLMGI